MDGKTIPLHWQVLFAGWGQWKLRGFVGYLPWPGPAAADR